MNRKRYIWGLVVLIMLVATACSTGNGDLPVSPPFSDSGEELPKRYMLTVNATQGNATRALVLDGDELKAMWKRGEQVKVYRKDNNNLWQEAGVLTAQSDGLGTVLSGVVSDVGVGTQLLFCFPESNHEDYSGQDGTIATIATQYDFAMTQASVVSIDDGAVTLDQATLNFQNQASVTCFNLTDGSSLPLSAGTLKIYADGLCEQYDEPVDDNVQYCNTPEHPLVLTPAEPTSVYYVVLRNTNTSMSTTYHFTAVVGDDIYTGTKRALLEAGNYYSATVKLTKQ